MKFSKKHTRYEASNVSLNLETLEAFSYDWWQFLKLINGKLVFNNYSYSNTTCKHQQKVRRVLDEKGIKIDVFVKTYRSLDGFAKNSANNYGTTEDALNEAIAYNKSEIEEIELMLANPRRKKALDDERKAQIKKLKVNIDQIIRVIKPTPLEQALYEN
jgi:hypothetical protein